MRAVTDRAHSRDRLAKAGRWVARCSAIRQSVGQVHLVASKRRFSRARSSRRPGRQMALAGAIRRHAQVLGVRHTETAVVTVGHPSRGGQGGGLHPVASTRRRRPSSSPRRATIQESQCCLAWPTQRHAILRPPVDERGQSSVQEGDCRFSVCATRHQLVDSQYGVFVPLCVGAPGTRRPRHLLATHRSMGRRIRPNRLSLVRAIPTFRWG